MEIISQPRVRPAYYFALLDHEILDDRLLSLSCDDDTWLYKSEIASINKQCNDYQLESPFQSSNTPSASGSVDSRTYTRRKHPMQTTPLSVVESSFYNRSSLGLLSPSKLLNDTILVNFPPTPLSENLGKTFSNSIASNLHCLPQRNFKFDSPFVNSVGLGKSTNYTFERNRIDSESSDISFPQSLENLNSFGKNDVMTDSLVNFLERKDGKCRPTTASQDEGQMTDSLISLSESCAKPDVKIEPMTDSMVNFLVPVHCSKPPSEFENDEMIESIIEIDGTNILPNYDLTKSAVDYLEDVKCNQNSPLIQSTTSSETENIPPHDIVIKNDSTHPCNIGTGDVFNEKGNNSTFEMEKNEDVTFNISNISDEIDNITFTNNANITRKRHDRGDHEDNFTIAKTVNGCFDKDLMDSKNNTEIHLKSKALNNRDLNIASDIKNNELLGSNSGKIKAKDFITQQSINRNGFIKDSDLNGTFTKLPSRNSTFNTTFTKLESSELSTNSISNDRLTSTTNQTKLIKGFNSTFVAKSSEMLCGGGLDDDQTSSASDSSFSSCSPKPRSIDELRTIARQQETSLVQQTSTPTGCSSLVSSSLAKLNLDLSPIRRQSIEGSNRVIESRSANNSPVRSPHPRMPGPHAIFQQTREIRKQSLQASSLSNIAAPKTSGLRLPQPISRLPGLRQSIARPSTAPTPKVTGIPRPQLSRLPKPTQYRSTGIPGLKRGGGYH